MIVVRILAEDSRERLLSVCREFVKRVSEPVLNQLLDKLLECCVINEDEILSATNRTENARCTVIDMVRNKGTEASSVLIDALCEVDPCLSRVLDLN